MTADTTNLDEAALIRRVQRGDTNAFGVLVDAYMKRAYAVAYRLMHHAEDAEDVVQDAFMTVLDTIQRFDVSRPFAPWFFRILRNQAINAQRARSVRRVEDIPEDAPSLWDGGDTLAERGEFLSCFWEAVNKLPEIRRSIVEMHDVEGMTSVEISQVLDMPAPTVRWHLREARRALREALAPFRRDGAGTMITMQEHEHE